MRTDNAGEMRTNNAGDQNVIWKSMAATLKNLNFMIILSLHSKITKKNSIYTL